MSRRPWVGNLLLALCSVGIAALFAGALEGALHGLELGAPDASRTSRLKYQQIYLPLLEPAQRPDGTPILRTADPRLPFQTLLAPKPGGTLRIVTVGGSATAGLGFSPNVTFARELERMFEHLEPDRPVEVLNLGIVALASEQVKHVVADVCRGYDPDVVIVYSGNNEFLEIHAEKYAALGATWPKRLAETLRDTNLYRLASRAVRGPPGTPAPSEGDASHDDLRVTEREIIRNIEMEPGEISAIVDRYEANFEAMVDVAESRGTPLVLVTVAANLRWRGRDDLPQDWLEALVPDAPESARLAQALEILDEHVADASTWRRHEWLYQRALVHEALGDPEAARRDYRAASDGDPHLRRALGAMAERVRAVGRRRGVRVVDAIAGLAARSPNGIVGFEAFYDYVHFNPHGALWLAADLHEALRALGLAGAELPADYLRARAAVLDSLSEDPQGLGDWLGFGFDRAAISDRDLWKYDRMLEDLDRRIVEDPLDARALAYRANAAYFRQEGATDAARDYRAALDAGGDPRAIRANLDRLRLDRRP